MTIEFGLVFEWLTCEISDKLDKKNCIFWDMILGKRFSLLSKEAY